MSLVVPQKLKKYKEGKQQKTTLQNHESITYKTPSGLIHVVLWSRYPTYDFIFGALDKSHKLYKDEAAYFEIRNGKGKRAKNTGYYLDEQELKEFQRGFNLIAKRGEGR